eukprot:gene5419-2966_t
MADEGGTGGGGAAAATAASKTAEAAAAPAEGAAAAGGAADGACRHDHTFEENFKITKWVPVGNWTYSGEQDNCAICRNQLVDLCINCQADTDSATSESCDVARGACSHTYHTHCITKWIKTRSTCPLDNSEWEYAQWGTA